MQGELALAKSDWSGAETAFLNALREAPSLPAALEGWIKTQVRKATPPIATVTSCDFGESKDGAMREVTILLNGESANWKEFCGNSVVEFRRQLGKLLEITNWDGSPPTPAPHPPHTVLREFLLVQFTSLRVLSYGLKGETFDCIVKFEFTAAKASVSEKPPADR